MLSARRLGGARDERAPFPVQRLARRIAVVAARFAAGRDRICAAGSAGTARAAGRFALALYAVGGGIGERDRGVSLVYQSARAAFAARGDELEMVARCLGASRARAFWTIALPLSWPGLVAGAVLAFARALGEFGATVMVAGNVAGRTLTAPVAIYFAANDGDMQSAAIYAALLGAFNLLFLIGLNVYRRRASFPR